MQWMAWTWPTATFFICVAVALLIMTLLEILWPCTPRRGLLPLVTTRGDRFFITLLISAFLHAGFLAVSNAPVYFVSLMSLALAFVLMRWG